MSASASARHAMPRSTSSKRGVYIMAGIAGGAAIALVAGGAGTFAAWNNQASISGGNVSTGELSVTSTTGTWYDVTSASTNAPSYSTANSAAVAASNQAAVPVAVPGSFSTAALSSFAFAPGDVLQYNGSLTIKAKGSDLSASLSSAFSGLTQTGGGTDMSTKFAISTALDTAHATATDDSGDTASIPVSITGSGPYTFSADSAGEIITVPVSITVKLKPYGSDDATVTDNSTQNNGGSTGITLGALTVNLQQTLPAAAN